MPKGENLRSEYRQVFRQDVKLQEWLKSLHPNTKPSYEFELARLCKSLNLTASQLLKMVEENPTELSKQVKIVLRQFLQNYSGTNASKSRAVLVSFLGFNELDLPLTGLKIRQGKAMTHPLLSWEDADRIISLVDAAYQPVFRLMQWGVDAERIVWINNDAKTLKDVKSQLDDSTRDFIKISIPRRKTNPNPFYILIPRQIASYLPIRTVRHEPLSSKVNIWHQWRQATRNAGFPVDRTHGAHNLRSCWDTEMTKRGLPKELRENHLGHNVDSLNYQRIMQDQSWVLEQFRKATGIQPVATKQELESRDSKIADLEKQLSDQSVHVKELQIGLRTIYNKLEDVLTATNPPSSVTNAVPTLAPPITPPPILLAPTSPLHQKSAKKKRNTGKTKKSQ